MAKAYVRLDKIKPSAHIETVVATEPLQNGQFLKLGKLSEELGGEAIEATKAAKGEMPDALLVTEHINYGGLDYNILDQVTKAGKVGRAFVLEAGNRVAFLKEMMNGAIVGDDVSVAEDGFGLAKQTLEEEIIGKVIGEDYIANIGDVLVVRFK